MGSKVSCISFEKGSDKAGDKGNCKGSDKGGGNAADKGLFKNTNITNGNKLSHSKSFKNGREKKTGKLQSAPRRNRQGLFRTLIRKLRRLKTGCTSLASQPAGTGWRNSANKSMGNISVYTRKIQP